MMTITSATKKSELVEVLKKSTAKVRKVNSELADRIKYATGMFAKDEKKVTRKDLIELLAEADNALAIPASASTAKPKAEKPKAEKPKATLKKKEDEPKAENLIKPAGLKKKEDAKAEKPKAEKPAPKKPAEKAEKPKVEVLEVKDSKKKPALKKDEKKSVQEKASEKKRIFPDSLTIETESGEVEYKLAGEMFKSFKDLEKYLMDENNPTIVMAVPATKKIAKETNYGWGLIPIPKDGFPNDFDVYVPIYLGQTNTIIHLASLYTDCPLQIVAGDRIDDVEEIEGVRYMDQLAYQIYVEA